MIKGLNNQLNWSLFSYSQTIQFQNKIHEISSWEKFGQSRVKHLKMASVVFDRIYVEFIVQCRLVNSAFGFEKKINLWTMNHKAEEYKIYLMQQNVVANSECKIRKFCHIYGI